MNTDLSPEAVEYGDTVRRALEAAGGDDLAQVAERDGDRGGATAKVLGDLGAWDLDRRQGADELEAAAALCRSAGWWGAPHPVAERVARPHDVEADALVIVAGARPSGAVAGTALRWVAVDLDGRRSVATPQPVTTPVRKSGWVAPLDLAPLDEGGAEDLALGLVLPCWTLLGMLDRAIALTADHVRERHQFGQPLSSFQGVQFQLTDAEVERVGLEELAKYALWSLGTGRPEVVADALALRVAAVEAAEVVFRITHQLHGAIGYCDETPLSWLSRASQPSGACRSGPRRAAPRSPTTSAGQGPDRPVLVSASS